MYEAEAVPYPKCNMFAMPPIYGGSGAGASAGDERLAALEARQQKILDDLKAMDAEVTKLSGGAAGAGVSAVVELSPKDVPITTLLVFEFLRRRNLCVSTSHCHSSLKRLPEELRASVETPNPYSATARPGASRLYFIWRSDGPPTLVQSPLTHAPIVGDGNIARFLCRVHELPLYEGAAASADATSMAVAAEVDKYLDLGRMIAKGSDKERGKLFKGINSTLHKQRFLADAAAGSGLMAGKPTLADLAVWAALEASGSRATACKMGDIARWDAELRALPEFAFLTDGDDEAGAAAGASGAGAAAGGSGKGSDQTQACAVM